jgi:hypothetical protein
LSFVTRDKQYGAILKSKGLMPVVVSRIEPAIGFKSNDIVDVGRLEWLDCDATSLTRTLQLRLRIRWFDVMAQRRALTLCCRAKPKAPKARASSDQ